LVIYLNSILLVDGVCIASCQTVTPVWPNVDMNQRL